MHPFIDNCLLCDCENIVNGSFAALQITCPCPLLELLMTELWLHMRLARSTAATSTRAPAILCPLPSTQPGSTRSITPREEESFRINGEFRFYLKSAIQWSAFSD